MSVLSFLFWSLYCLSFFDLRLLITLLTASRAHEFTPVFIGVRVTRSLVFCVVFCRSLFILLSFFLPSLVVRRKLSHFNLLLRNHWANCNQILVEWSLDGPLPKLCPVIPISNQDGHQAKNRKKGGMKF